MNCTACTKRQAARRRGGLYQLGGIMDGMKIDSCPQCVASHNAYAFKERKETTKTIRSTRK